MRRLLTRPNQCCSHSRSKLRQLDGRLHIMSAPGADISLVLDQERGVPVATVATLGQIFPRSFAPGPGLGLNVFARVSTGATLS